MTTPHPIEDLIQLMARLRAPDGCPWDREQTHESLRTFVLEEAYEVVRAIDQQDMGELKDELGDLLFQVVFQARLTEEAGRFDFDDVVRAITEKMTRRHAHVFGDRRAETAENVADLWERQKKEREGKGTFDGLPAALPALLKAWRVQKKAARLGFDWPDAAGPTDKIHEELRELEAAVAADDADAREEEMGDLLFSVVNLARKLDVNPEFALGRTVDKFITRFQGVERLADDRGIDLEAASLEEMDALWDEVKGASATK